MAQRLRIFVSSPNDVPDERLRADLIIDKVSQDYSRFFAIESYRWEHEALLASKHFQDAIELPSAFDIVVLILWSRLGTPLPERTEEREYRGIDGRAPVTGTEWEYEEALKAAREKGAPDLLAFRNISPAPFDTNDPEARARSNAQLDALDQFWTRHFADRGIFLAAYDQYRTLEEFARRLEESLRKLIERRIKSATAGAEPIWRGDPFRGLESYEFEHAPIFFGRDAAVTKATEQLAGNARSGCAFLLVSGASGSGKSSLVKAGIVPRLMKPQRISGLAFLRYAVFRPGIEGADVVLGLARALTRSSEPNVGLPELIAQGQDASQLAAHLRGAAGEPGYVFANALGRLTQVGRQEGRLLAFEDAKFILVVDQLEELFTLSGIGAEERRLFVRLLAGLARSNAVWVIATLRADFWHRAAEIPELVAVAQGHGRIDLAAPTAAELADMIRKPAQVSGLTFEAHAESSLGLDVVLAEHAAAAPGALPLLSFTLDELHKSAKGRGETILRHASYEALGGLEGAIANRADEVEAVLPQAAQFALPRLVRALTTVTGAAEQAPIARTAPLASFIEGSPARILIDAFIAARLLVAGDAGAAATVRLAHEALISRWQRARDQLTADHRDLETRVLLERQQARWVAAVGRQRHQLLLRDPDLAAAIDLERRWKDELSDELRNFIKQSRQAATLATRVRWAAAALIMMSLGGLIGATYWQRGIAVENEARAVAGEEQAKRNEAQARVERDRALETQSLFLADLARQQRTSGDAGTAMLLALEALPDSTAGTLRPYTTEAEFQLDGSLRALRERRVFKGHTAPVWQAKFSPDGRMVVTASNDQTTRLWEKGTGLQIGVPLEGHSDFVRSAEFNHDGKIIVTASFDKTLRLWDAITRQPIGPPLKGHEKEIWSASFSSDDRHIVSGSRDGTARLWDVVSRTMIGQPFPCGDAVLAASFSPDGSRILMACYFSAFILDVETKKKIAGMFHAGMVRGAAFSTDGNRIVTASDDKTAQIWDAQSGKPVGEPLKGHEGEIRTATFNSEGRLILTASYDKTARLWDTRTGKPFGLPFKGHDAAVFSANFSSDGDQIVTASQDGTARLWDLAPEKQTILSHQRSVWSAAFSPHGSRIITASGNAVRLWDAITGKPLGDPLAGHENTVNSAMFSPDGKRIVTASDDKTVRLWDADTGKQIGDPLRGHEDYVKSAAFSPDGERIASASYDKMVRLWDAHTGKPIGEPLKGHEGQIFTAMFSPDGKRIVSASWDRTARLWNVETGEQIGEPLRGHDGGVYSAAFSPDGRLIVTSSYDKTARIWDAASGRLVGEPLTGHTFYVNSAAFSPDGTRIVTASSDRTIRVWDTKTGKPVAELEGHTHWVERAAFSADGKRIISASRDNTARIWNVFASPQDLVAHAKTVVPRCLSATQRSAFFLSPEPPAWCIELEKWPYHTAEWKKWLADARSGKKPRLPVGRSYEPNDRRDF